ncbi:hypothetical protein [Thalassoglobus polymorphus]|uniref:Uncharacterized protein n=1 Tax=Thalassoglobus polymorphus TaxID=2527994 RepID=A0A517QR28_9PLAN|nr:hypothetical protein [Thalassoglobus polymorphus]QDT34082.1 hypothetical protein Mal48_33420 [Thalassoglobus polymorphus]
MSHEYESTDNYSVREQIGYRLLGIAHQLNEPEVFYNAYEMFPGMEPFDTFGMTPNEVFYWALNDFNETLDSISRDCLSLESEPTIRSVHSLIEIARFQLDEPFVLYTGTADNHYCEAYLKVLFQLKDDLRADLQKIGGKLIADEKLRRHNSQRFTKQNDSDCNNYLGLKLDEADRSVVRNGKRLRFKTDGQWDIFRIAFKAGERGTTREAWLEQYSGEKGMGSRAPDAAKNRLKDKLKNIGITLDNGSTLKLIEWDGIS